MADVIHELLRLASAARVESTAEWLAEQLVERGFVLPLNRLRPLTRRQREIFNYVAGHIEAKGYAPSFQEIAETFEFQSLATVHEHLTNLEWKGYIRRSHNESRAIEILDGAA